MDYLATFILGLLTGTALALLVRGIVPVTITVRQERDDDGSNWWKRNGEDGGNDE
ncbi:MAG TPA: hypothetical protein VEA69_00550 [Tepidisphaeraceae bacterium]|nr:hypothetical protein [Tepidisphaeraceae bacterium]